MGPVRLTAVLRQIADRIERSANPSRTLVAQDLHRVVTALRLAEETPEMDTGAKKPKPKAPKSAPSGGGIMGNTPEIEQAIYNHSGGEKDPNMQGSSIWWLVFNEVGMEDWTPMTDFSAVEQKAKELLTEWSKGWGSGNPEWMAQDPAVKDKENQVSIQRSLKELKNNWADYQKSYMPEHTKILQEKGLM